MADATSPGRPSGQDSSPSAPGSEGSDFVETVYREEIAYVAERRRWASKKGGAEPSEEPLADHPTTGNRLVGLALSGGGIRSATFNLGILQALRRRGLFRSVDLLSTVSGGGFIGSCLTSLMSGGAGFPFNGETPAVTHLRNNSNYLAPKGPLDYLRMFAVLIRGIILNFLVLVPWLLVPCLLTTLVYGPRLLRQLEYDETAASALAHLNSALVTQLDDGESPMELQTKGGEKVQPLIDLLASRAFVPLTVAQHDRRITVALQERNRSFLEVTEPLITGTGSDTAPTTFEQGVTLSDVVHRLVDTGLFEPDSEIKEIQVVELFLRSKDLRLGGFATGGDPEVEGKNDGSRQHTREDLASLLSDLDGFLPKLPKPEPATKSLIGAYLKGKETQKRGDTSSSNDDLPRLFMVFVTKESLVQALANREIIVPIIERAKELQCSGHSPECWDFARDAEGKALYSLSQILQAFYDARLFDRRWLAASSRGAFHDHDLAYRWPDDLPGHLEIEQAALELWGLLGETRRKSRKKWSGGDISVEDLFEAIASDGAQTGKDSVPMFQQDLLNSDSGFLRTLERADIVAKTAGQKSKGAPKSAADFASLSQAPDLSFHLLRAQNLRFVDDTSLLRLHEVLYEGHFYNRVWFCDQEDLRSGGSLGRSLWAWTGSADECPAEIHYERPGLEVQESEEIAAAGEALGLPPGASVTDLFESIRLKRDASQRGEDLFLPSSRLTEQEILQALRETYLVEGSEEDCGAESLEQCFFATAVGADAVSRLFYRLEFYLRDWFTHRPSAQRAPVVYQREWTLRKSREEIEKGDRLENPSKAYAMLRKLPDPDENTACPDTATAGPEPQLAECLLSDEALLSLYDRKHFQQEVYGDAKNKHEVDAGTKNPDVLQPTAWMKIEGFVARYLAQRAERILWNPNELRVPLTATVSIIGLAWVLLYPIVVAVSSALERRGRGRLGPMERSFSTLMVVIAAVAFLELQPYLIYHWHHLDVSFNWAVIIGLASVVSTLAAGPALAFFKKFGRRVVLLLVSILGPLLPFVIYLTVISQVIYSEAWPTRDGYSLNVGFVLLFFLLIAIGAHLLLQGLDPNSTSIHDFYRGRLSVAYLVGRSNPGELVPSEDLKLSDICRPETAAPYHLINVALNLQGSKDPSYRERNSDFFIFSKKFLGGGRHSGYCPTEKMEEALPSLDLGTAMAISGAAAAPNMGAVTVGPLVILLALLNIRLGYWLPNPRYISTPEAPTDPDRPRSVLGRLRRLGANLLGFRRLRPGPYLFLRELAGKMDDEGRYINVSDGGHLENTAIFELLRRRCRFIIAGDAEADPTMSFAGLATLVRYARIDLNVEIEIDVSALRPENERSSRHFAVGEIHYPGDRGSKAEVGYLIYLKASITGNEDPVVSEYHRRQSDFPHQSTADQFFDESQFEAYRALGSHIVDSLFEDLRSTKLPEPVLEFLRSPEAMATSSSPITQSKVPDE